ncbi:MAG: hemolysin family protein [Rhodoluna sp.]
MTVALWSAALLALLTLITAVVKAALEFDDQNSEKAESLSFVRLSLTGIFGVLVGEAFTPLGLAWWWSASLAFALMLALLISSQFASRKLGNRVLGRRLLKLLGPLVNSVHLLFTPLSLPKLDIPEEFEQELLDSVEEFGETIVREIMVPRVDMATVPAEANLTKAMSIFLARGYSRLPVIGKDVDDVRGVLYIKDVARLLHESPEDMVGTLAESAARSAIFVPESKPVDDLLREMQSNSRHIAIIVDEYGGVAGLATMEDVIEEIVGEISDEYDREIPDVETLDDGSLRVNSRFSLFELGELFKLELEDEDVDSVGGLLTKELGKLPKRGDGVSFSGLTFTADRIEGRRKRLITVIVKRDQDLADIQSAFDAIEQEN